MCLIFLGKWFNMDCIDLGRTHMPSKLNLLRTFGKNKESYSPESNFQVN